MSTSTMNGSDRLDTIVQIGQSVAANQQTHDDMVILSAVAIISAAVVAVIVLYRKLGVSE